MPKKWEVTLMFSVDVEDVERLTETEWYDKFVSEEVLSRHEIPREQFTYEDVATILAMDYIGGGEYVHASSSLETTAEVTEED